MIKWGLLGALAVFSASACDPDIKVAVYHEPPTVTITAPSDLSEFSVGESVRFEGLVASLDGTDLTDMEHGWVSGNTTICEDDTVPADGIVKCTWIFTTAGKHTVTVTVTDPQLDRADATVVVELIVNEAPNIEIVTPEDDDVYDPADLVVVQANVWDAETPKDQLEVSIISSIDGLIPHSSSPTSAGQFTVGTNFSHGLHLLTLEVTDGIGQTGQAFVTFGVNGRPPAPLIHIDPGSPVSGESFRAVIDVDSVDPDGDTISYVYAWSRDGSAYQSGSNPAIPTEITSRNEYWEVVVTAWDDFGPGVPAIAAVTILNSPPSIVSVGLSPTDPNTQSTLVATPSGWLDYDGDPESYDYAWYVNGSLDLATLFDTLGPSRTARGDEVYVSVTPKDSLSSGVSVLSATVIIGNTPPEPPVVRIVPAAPDPSEDLICQVVTGSYDADLDSVTYTYQWFVNGAPYASTDPTVPAIDTDLHDIWECRVTPHDGTDDGAYASYTVSVSDTTAPDPPFLDSVAPHRNEDEMTISGTCEPDCLLDIACQDATGVWTLSSVCDSLGLLSETTPILPADTTTCFATCTDAAGNTSSLSNPVTTEVCDPTDPYENSSGYGDTPQDAIDQWNTLADDGLAQIDIEANILESADSDWYVVATSDDWIADSVAGIDLYNFNVRMTAGLGVYRLFIFKGGYDSADQECSVGVSGSITEYNDFSFDSGDADHTPPADTRACGVASPDLNECSDFSNLYYIEVQRKATAAPSCQHYELELTNGVW